MSSSLEHIKELALISIFLNNDFYKTTHLFLWIFLLAQFTLRKSISQEWVDLNKKSEQESGWPLDDLYRSVTVLHCSFPPNIYTKQFILSLSMLHSGLSLVILCLFWGLLVGAQIQTGKKRWLVIENWKGSSVMSRTLMASQAVF